MIKFDLERALAGDKVINREGSDVEQLVKFKTNDEYSLFGVIDGGVCSWCTKGKFYRYSDGGNDLFMAPKKLSGFVNVYSNNFYHSTIHKTRMEANTQDNRTSTHRLACIDLSHYEEGEGI